MYVHLYYMCFLCHIHTLPSCETFNSRPARNILQGGYQVDTLSPGRWWSRWNTGSNPQAYLHICILWPTFCLVPMESLSSWWPPGLCRSSWAPSSRVSSGLVTVSPDTSSRMSSAKMKIRLIAAEMYLLYINCVWQELFELDAIGSSFNPWKCCVCFDTAKAMWILIKLCTESPWHHQ